jgi:hypothetical protein
MRTVIAFNEAFNRHDVAGMRALMSDDCLFENTDPAPDGAVFSGNDAVALFWGRFLPQFTPGPYPDRRDIRPRRAVRHALEIQLGRFGRCERACAGSGYLQGERRFDP